MLKPFERPALSAFAASFAALALGSSAAAQEAGEPVIARALGAVSEEVRVFNEHLTILASPWMEGRVPGSRGMELAKEYMEYQFRQSGLVPPYERVVEHEDGTVERIPNGSFRQPFPMGSKTTISEGYLALGGDLQFEHGAEGDFVVTAMGSGGEVTAPVVFVGYGIDRGPREARDFTSFPDGVDLAGKIALVFRFEPMDEDGQSQWSSNNRRSNSWSIRASFSTKLRALEERGVAAAIIVNTPGAADSRVDQLVPPTQSRRSVDFPVLNLSIEAGERLVAAAVPGSHSLMDLRRMADAGPAAVELSQPLTLRAGIVEERLVAENIIGLLPGKGRLKDQYIVVGAHLDHLGMGEFGSRDDRENRGRKLHPGADDNASGSAGIMIIADKMARDYRAAPDDANLRSVLFMGFSAEESGLNGSRYYAQNPLVPADKHTLMMNFDMIGRISDKRLSLSGAETGDGLAAFIEPIVDASPLTIVQPDRLSGASDHTSFLREQIPVLFAIIADFHDDYHTTRDTPEKINRVDAVHASNLFYEIASAAASRPEPFPFVQPGGNRARPSRPDRGGEEAEEEPAEAEEPRGTSSSVRLGIAPGNYGDAGGGVLVSDVFTGTSATKAGIQKGDVIVRWGEDEITSVEDLSAKLAAASPGDKVKMRVKRGDAEVDLDVVLFAR